MIDNTRAAYRILAVHGFYGPDDTLYTVDAKGDPAEIYFEGEPNEEMEPLNELARLRLNAYLEKLDDLGRAAAEKAGRPFVARPRSLDGQLELASAIQRDGMNIMGARKETTVERVEADPIQETGRQVRKPGRPKGSLSIGKVA